MKQFDGRASVLCVLFLVLATMSLDATPWTPAEWQNGGKLRGWVRDANDNFVDDLIEAEEGQVDIVVDLNSCAGDPATSPIIAYLNTEGDVVYIGRYISFVVVTGVDAKRADHIAARSEVAMVEMAAPGKWLGDNARAAKVQASGDYSPNTLGDGFGWSATLDGSGVGIAFLDSGAGPAYDASVTHGYNALTDVEGNPPPNPAASDHATWMASWVFGPGGIAPGADLIDIKVGDGDGPDPAATLSGLEKVYERHDAWQINVVTMMFSGSVALDGSEAQQKLIDLLAGHGIVVVAGSGTNSDDVAVTGPGAATRAIGISAADIEGTVNRGDDTASFVHGPRQDDGDADQLDELKPELVIPTGEGDTAISVSIAAATAAGLTALILQHEPTLADFDNAAAGSVKDLLLRTAEPKGGADTAIRYPQTAATWDEFWGFGEVDAHEAFRRLSGQVDGGRTDMTFLNFDDSAHPSDPWYFSAAIETQSQRDGDNISAGAPDRIFARVYNNGERRAERVRISFGFYPFTAGVPSFHDVGSMVEDFDPGENREISFAWTPPDLPAGEDHGCILVTIDYGLDSSFAGRSNAAQKNVRIEPTGSPAEFVFQVANPLPQAADIKLEVKTRFTDWTLKLSEANFRLEQFSCAQTITAWATPPTTAKPGTEATFFVTAVARPVGQEKEIEVGGVALTARVTESEGYRWWIIPLIIVIAVLMLVIFRMWVKKD